MDLPNRLVSLASTLKILKEDGCPRNVMVRVAKAYRVDIENEDVVKFRDGDDNICVSSNAAMISITRHDDRCAIGDVVTLFAKDKKVVASIIPNDVDFLRSYTFDKHRIVEIAWKDTVWIRNDNGTLKSYKAKIGHGDHSLPIEFDSAPEDIKTGFRNSLGNLNLPCLRYLAEIQALLDAIDFRHAHTLRTTTLLLW